MHSRDYAILDFLTFIFLGSKEDSTLPYYSFFGTLSHHQHKGLTPFFWSTFHRIINLRLSFVVVGWWGKKRDEKKKGKEEEEEEEWTFFCLSIQNCGMRL